MIKQNDLKLNKKIQAYGCNKLSHLAMIRQNWLADEVELVYHEALKQGIIDENCTVKNPNGLLALAGSKLRQIGGIDLITGNRWGVAEDDPRVQYRIARWSQRNSKHQHFTLWNGNGELYDPYDASTATYKLEKQTLIGVQFYG